MAKADDLARSLRRVAPQATIDPAEEPAPDPWDVIVKKLDDLELPAPNVTVRPPNIAAPDLAPLLEAIRSSRLDVDVLSHVVAAAVVAGFSAQPDIVGALEKMVEELEALRKKMNNAVRGGGGGGGPSEVGLRTGPDGSVVSEANPLPVTFVSTSGVFDYRAGVGADSVVLTPGQRVKKITAIALGAQGTFTIDGGDTITLPYDSTDHTSSSLEMVPEGTLDGATIDFDANVDSWVVEFEIDA